MQIQQKDSERWDFKVKRFALLRSNFSWMGQKLIRGQWIIRGISWSDAQFRVSRVWFYTRYSFPSLLYYEIYENLLSVMISLPMISSTYCLILNNNMLVQLRKAQFCACSILIFLNDFYYGFSFEKRIEHVNLHERAVQFDQLHPLGWSQWQNWPQQVTRKA